MVARSRCTTETVEPCVMGIVACGTVLVSGLRACGRAVWRREDRTGAPRTVPQQRSTEGRQAMPRGDEEAKARSDPLGPCGPRVTPLGVARRPHAQDDDASKRGGSRGTPWRAVGGARGGHGSRTRGPGAPGWTGRQVDPRALVPPLPHALRAAGRGSGGRTSQVPTATQGPRLGAGGEKAILPQPPKTAGQSRPEAATEACVRLARPRLAPLALTPLPVGQADPPVPPVEAPMVGQSAAMGRAADSVQDVCRACQGGLGGDPPLLWRRAAPAAACWTQECPGVSGPPGGARQRGGCPGAAPRSTGRDRLDSRPAPATGSGARPPSSAPPGRRGPQPP